MSLRRVVAVATPLVLLSAGPALAKPRPQPQPSPATYDVSYPQCGVTLPSNATGGIVGVNDGNVYSANPCLATEWAWAAQRTSYAPALYANTADPGPAYSSHWPPAGTTTPQPCDGTNSRGCSYDYGYNAAQNSYDDATAAGIATPSAYTWWLDVETGNSWETLESAYGQNSTAQSNDIAALQGAVDGLKAKGVGTVGIYSTSYQWGQITGGTSTTFAANPAWVAGTSSLSTAQSNCTTASFTTGPILLTQYASSGFDADYHCA